MVARDLFLLKYSVSTVTTGENRRDVDGLITAGSKMVFAGK